jgi:short-subunit dehydrogenase
MASSFTATQHLEAYPRLSPSLLRGELQGKAILITGGGQGIGASIARSFAEANVGSIILVGRTESNLKATTTNLAQSFLAMKSLIISSTLDRIIRW